MRILDDISRTFSEFLILPQLTQKAHTIDKVSLKTPLGKFSRGQASSLYLNVPIVSSAMQAVSCSNLAIALALHGGLASIHCSQLPDEQVAMIQNVKKFKAGFVKSKANVSPEGNLAQIRALVRTTGHTTIAVTEDGSATGNFLGLVFAKDIWPGESNDKSVADLMVSKNQMQSASVGISLDKAIALLRGCNQRCIPILTENNGLDSLVFRRDAFSLNEFPLQLLDTNSSLMVSAAINTHDYQLRVPQLIEAKADCLFFDSSDGYSEYQKAGFDWIRAHYGNAIVVGGGNVVNAEGFRYLVKECGADFVKVGIGGGSICVTREQKGIGRGQASALMDVVQARNQYYEETGMYVPVCSDGGLANDTQIIIALALGADFVMMGRYFAALEESASTKVNVRGKTYKAYWGEGSHRAKNWQRYSDKGAGSSSMLQFEEGVDAFVPYTGTVAETLPITLSKLKSTMINCGSLTLQEFTDKAVLTMVSPQTFVEGGTSDVLLKEQLLSQV
ncbi:MAG: IMP dehydrogenase [Gammaproteobacteria bacterium]